MIILINGYGDHCNRLFQAIHVEAYCLKNNIKYYNPSFRNMSKYYGINSSSFDSIFCFLIKGLNKLKIIKIYDIVDKEKKILFLQGWLLKNYILSKEYKKFFSDKYLLLPEYYQDNDLYKTLMKIKHTNIVIGIHIRRGDYKDWENGKYYYSDEIYQNIMNNFSLELKKTEKKEIQYIIFSNDIVTIKENEKIIISYNEWYIDQFLMSMCDYLIGPPSTFTLWASYIGNVKYFHIKDKTSTISKNDFKICEG